MKRILFVDDEPQVLSSLKRSFRNQKLSWVLDFAGSGKEALEILEYKAFDVIVTDVRMPEMNGQELLQIVTERYPEMVQIILSGMRIQPDQYPQRFGLQVLQKPCPIYELVRTIERGLFLKDIFQMNFLSQLRECFSEYSTFPDLMIRIQSQKQLGDELVRAAAEITCTELGIRFRIPLNQHEPASESELV